jgi:hypothetical protein
MDDLVRRLRTRAPYKSNVQIMVELFGPEPPVVVLGQGDYPTALMIANRVTADMNAAADRIEQLTRERDEAIRIMSEPALALIKAEEALAIALDDLDEWVGCKDSLEKAGFNVDDTADRAKLARTTLAEIEKEDRE